METPCLAWLCRAELPALLARSCFTLVPGLLQTLGEHPSSASAGTGCLHSWLENVHQNFIPWEKSGLAKLKHSWDSVLKLVEAFDAPTSMQRSVGSQGWARERWPHEQPREQPQSRIKYKGTPVADAGEQEGGWGAQDYTWKAQGWPCLGQSWCFHRKPTLLCPALLPAWLLMCGYLHMACEGFQRAPWLDFSYNKIICCSGKRRFCERGLRCISVFASWSVACRDVRVKGAASDFEAQ